MGTSGYDSVTSIAIDSNDSPYFIGYTNSQSFITRYSSDGSREWTELAGEGEVAAQAVTEDVDGSMLIAGITGGGYYTPKDAVISKINDDGGFDWSKTVGSLGIGGAVKDISVGNKGEIYIIGQDYDSVNHRANHFLSKYEYKIPDYKVTTTHWNDNSQTSIDEGEWITTTVSTENVNQGTELYWEVEGVQGDITLSDFSQGELKGFSPIYGTFADGGFSIPHLIAEDLTTEGLESMVIKLFSDQARNELLAQSSTVEINDSSKTPPPSIPDLIATSDSGISNSDNITSDNTPTFSGTAKAGSSVELFADGISLGSSITDSNSNWAYTVANDSPLADGSIAITATTTTETATSASDPSDPLNLTIDATAPAFSSGETAAPIEENSGAAQVIYTAAADDASDVSYSLKQNNSDDAASFSIDPSTGKVSLKDDPDYENKTSYSFSVSATDLAGNSSEQDLNLGILNQPKASTPDLIATSDSGISNSDNLTNDNTPTFSGTAKAGSSVELFADGISLGSSTTDSNSNWSYTVANDSPLADGSIAITATSTETTSDLKRTAIPVAAPGRTTHEWRNKYAFAALKDDGSVVTWGDSEKGGDSSSVDLELSSGINQIFSNPHAFAALKDDGSVVTWGDSEKGGDSSSVDLELSSGVNQIFSTEHAFAALKDDGSVVTWGASDYGGDSSSVDLELSSGVNQIFSANMVFAALKDDGSVVTWGILNQGGDSSSVDLELSSGVNQIFSTSGAIAALKDDGSVVTWGDSGYGGDSNSVDLELGSGVNQIFSTKSAFAALKDDGSVVSWGASDFGGDSSSVDLELSSGVNKIFSAKHAFAALKDDGSVVSWGFSDYGGDSSSVDLELSSGVNQIFSTGYAFAALKDDGSVVSWGASRMGGDNSSVDLELSSGVSQIFSTGYAFAALKDDGSVVTWGGGRSGGDSSSDISSVDLELSSGVNQIFSTETAFAALKDDGSVVSWGSGVLSSGDPNKGGDSSSVAADLSSGVVSFADPFHDDRLIFGTITSDPSDPLNLTIDATAPTFSSGHTTNPIEENSGAAQVIYTAAADDASAVSYSLKQNNSDDAASFSIDSSTGKVSLTDDPDYENKPSYSFSVSATDLAGNSSEQDLNLGILNQPKASTPDLIVTSDSGNSDSDNLTNDNTPSFSGTAEAGSSVELFADGISLGSSITDSNSNWSYTVANEAPLADGSIAITATTTTEHSTSTSDPSDPLSLTIDATAPAFSSGETAAPIEENSGAAQVIYTAAADDASAVSYSLKQNNNDDAASFSFDASTGKVSLKDDPDYETNPSYSFSVSATDLAGNSSEQDVNLGILNQPKASTPDLIATSDSGISDSDNLTNDNTPSFSGTAKAGSSVEIFADGISLGSSITDSNSNWAYTVANDNPLADGSIAITATTTETSGRGLIQRTAIPVASPGRTTHEWGNNSAFAALKDDGSVVSWGDSRYGGDSSSVDLELSSGVNQIFSTKKAFAALKDNGSVVTWGDSSWGGDSSSVDLELSSGVNQIFSNNYAFAAVKDDGSVVTWGESDRGGDSSSVAADLSSGINQIFSSYGAFAAVKDDGSVVSWGDSERGGDSSSVADQLSSGVVSFADPFHDDRLTVPTSTSDPSDPLNLTIDTTAPAFSSGETAAPIEENSGAAQVIYTAAADDASAVSYSLKQGNSDDAASFSIDPSTGKVSLKDDPDYETKTSYSFSVSATDLAGNSNEQDVNLEIKDIHASYILSTSSDSLNEGEQLTSTVSTHEVISGSEVYWSLSGTGINQGDFTEGDLSGSGQTDADGKFSFSHTLRNDQTREGPESLDVKLFTDALRTEQVGNTASVEIKDTSMSTHYVRRGESAYVIVDGPSWQEAEAYAQRIGGNLVTINDEAENQWLHQAFQIEPKPDSIANPLTEPTWLYTGFNDVDSEGDWEWSSGEDVTYTNWWGSDWPAPEKGWLSNTAENYMHLGFIPPDKWNDTANNGTIQNRGGIAEISLARNNPDIANQWTPNPQATPDSDLELGYSLHSINGNDTQTDLKQLAVLGDSVDWQDTYRLDITAKSLADGYDLETADITINFDPYLFNEIKASDIKISGDLPIANAVRIDNDVGSIRIAAASLGDLEAGDLYGNHLADAGSRIGADGGVVASIELDFNEFRLDTLTQNSNGKILDPSTPLFFGLSANQDETVFSKALDDGSGLANREIKSLRDLGGDLAVDGTKVTLYEATINLEEQGDGLILSTERVIGSYNPISTNLLRSGDTISTSSTWTNVGNIEAQNIQVTGITNSNAELVESESYFAYQGIDANGDWVSRNSLNSGSFRSDTGEFDSTAQESGQLHAAIKITGAAGNVVDLGLGIASLQADGSDLFSNQKGSKNLITFQGDLNYDGRVSMKDLAYLNAGAARQQQISAADNPTEVDTNNDGVVDASVATAVDANFDGQISMEDLAVLDADWGQSLHQPSTATANGSESSFNGSDDISWQELDSQGLTGDAAWDNQAFKDQNAVEASNDFVQSLESPTAVGVIGMNGNTINNDVPEGGKGDSQDESLTL
ncbi:Ig-like domain-containing protein [Prochlorococcus sp. P1361]|uniref:Ig-like domain-containing protein n=1 Tax=Prochlorococcus sp. P1361 TaxID=2729589 RepID=UPI001F0F798A|nr:Ig-like domain-containing protein [Prochlorococcus sp. P1361]